MFLLPTVHLAEISFNYIHTSLEDKEIRMIFQGQGRDFREDSHG